MKEDQEILEFFKIPRTFEFQTVLEVLEVREILESGGSMQKVSIIPL